MSPEVIIVGGGIAGLTCAWKLKAAGYEVLVLEAADQPGGNVRSDPVDGFLLERGPHTFMPSADDVFTLARELKQESELTGSRKEAQARFIVRRGKLHRAPMGPGSFLSTRLLSFRGKWRLATEPFRTKDRGSPDDTAAQFFARRFGPEAARILAGAFISGIYAGDPEKLSAPAAFPLFWGFEQEAGSMIRGAWRHRKGRRKSQKGLGGPVPSRGKGLFSFNRGLGQLSRALADRLSAELRLGHPVRTVRREGINFSVETPREQVLAPRLVMAVPPPQAGAILTGLDPELGELLRGIPMAPMAVIHLGYHARRPEVPEGFGFLAPRGEGVRSLGVLFPSRLFEGRVPDNGELLTGYVGGVKDPQALELDDSALSAIVLADLEKLIGLKGRPDLVRVVRHEQAIPQFNLGHLARMAKIHERLRKNSGLLLAGNYLKGVGLKDAVSSGLEGAAQIVTPNRQERGQG